MGQRCKKVLEFINVLEDDKPRLSLTKIGLWCTTLANVGNIIAQVADQIRAVLTDTPAHPSILLLAATTGAHAVAAAKHEMQRWTEAP